MELLVVLAERIEVVPRTRRGHLVERLVEPGQVRVGQIRGRQAGRQTLERSADQVQLLDILLPDLGDAGTDSRLERDEALGVEDPECLANGHRRDPESRREVGRPQRLARSQLPVEDELSKPAGDRLRQRMTVFGLAQDRIEIRRVFASGHRLAPFPTADVGGALGSAGGMRSGSDFGSVTCLIDDSIQQRPGCFPILDHL